MGLRDDNAAMERHQRAGTLREWFEGTAKPIKEEYPLDSSIGKEGYAWLRERGE